MMKDVLLAHLEDSEFAKFRRRVFDKRPAEELCDLKSDPYQLINVADQSVFIAKLLELCLRVDRRMQATNDSRVDAVKIVFDTYPYYGQPAPQLPRP